MKEITLRTRNCHDNGMEYERCGRSGVLPPKVRAWVSGTTLVVWTS